MTVFSNSLLAKKGENSQSSRTGFEVLDNIQIDDLKGGFGVTVIVRNTGEIGIRSSIIAEEWPQLLHRLYTTDDWDMVFVGWGPHYNDPDAYIAPFIGSADIGQDTYNTGYQNETVDEEILEAKYSTDPAVRAAAYKAAFDIYIQEPPYIFLVQQQYIRPMRDWIMNYSYNPAPGLSWHFYDYYKAGLDDTIFS